MFKRRRPKTLLKQFCDFLWPSMGWTRSIKYVKHRVLRLSDSVHKVAGGLAVGVAISYTPIVGTHFIQAAAISYFCRFNILAAIIGTFLGNPWTFAFMWWAAMSFGSFLFGLFGFPADVALPEHMSFSILWELITHEPERIFLPWLFGGYLLGFISWFPAYYIFYYLVKAAKAARAKARMIRMHRIARGVTGQKK